MRRAAAAGATLALAFPAAASAHGDHVPVSQLHSAWHADPWVLLPAALALVLFAQAFVRLRRRGRADHASVWRAVLFVAAVAVATLALVSPPDAVGDEYLLSAHMAQHMLIGDIAPALALLALRGPLLFFFVPAVALRRLATLRPLRSALGFLLRPWVAWGAWTLVMLGWHVPSAYDYALAHDAVHRLEHVSFIVVGLLVWMLLIDADRHRRLTVGGRLTLATGLLLMGHFAHGTLFGNVAVYTPYANQDERLLGLSPLADQHLAGFLMIGELFATVGVAALVLLVLWRRQRTTAVAALERPASLPQ